MPKGKCKFKKSLMEKPKYSWLKPRKTVHVAKCCICDKEFGVDWGCEAAVIKHAGGKTHGDNKKVMENSKKGLSSLFFRKLPSSSSADGADASSSKNNETIIDKMISGQAAVTRAEILMILRVVNNHQSFRSCLELGEDLKNMFVDSAIATEFTLSKTKCGYVVKYGISPWIKENLRKDVCNSPFYSVSFDESLNKQMQEIQMDIQIRFWCDRTNKAVTQYWGSQFQMNTDANTLSENLLKSLEGLPEEKLSQSAMDGPSTNWKLFKQIQEMR